MVRFPAVKQGLIQEEQAKKSTDLNEKCQEAIGGIFKKK
jgi:hypothetical protein